MTRLSLTSALIALPLLWVMSAPAQPQEKPDDKPAAASARQDPFARFQQFSAILNGGMGRDTNRQIYRSGKLMRFDFDDHHRISDLESKTSWLVYPDKCSKFPMLDPGVFPFARKFRVESSTPVEAKETVDGHLCKVEDMVLVADKPIPTTFKMRLYEAEDLDGFPLRIEVENPMNKAKFTISYSAASLQPPDPKLFQHAAKCDTPPLRPIAPAGAAPKASKPAGKAATKPAPKKAPAQPAEPK